MGITADVAVYRSTWVVAMLLVLPACRHMPPDHGDAAAPQPAAGVAHADVRLRNPLREARPAGVVMVPLPPALRGSALQVHDLETGMQVPVQSPASADDHAHALVLLDFAPEQVRTVRLQPVQPAQAVSVSGTSDMRAFGRHVPERKDDFAWENDRIAFRMYGPALAATGEVSSGIDVWAKRTRALVIDRWYAGDDYHVDHGEGMDFFSVGKRRGCGGIAMLQGRTSAVSGNYIRWRQLGNGPLRVEFELDYAPWGLPGTQVAETKRITLDAGSNFTAIRSRFSAPPAAGAVVPLAVGIGEPGAHAADPRGRWISVWGDAHAGQGRIACAVVMETAGQPRQQDDQYWLARSVSGGTPTLAYYTGAAWSRGLDFNDAQAWKAEVQAFARRVAAPVQVLDDAD